MDQGRTRDIAIVTMALHAEGTSALKFVSKLKTCVASLQFWFGNLSPKVYASIHVFYNFAEVFLSFERSASRKKEGHCGNG